MEAVQLAYDKCAAAMIQTTCICGLGLLPVVLLEFLPTRDFVLLMLAILVIALIGDLSLLPAILLRPAGKLFVRNRTDVSMSEESS